MKYKLKLSSLIKVAILLVLPVLQGCENKPTILLSTETVEISFDAVGGNKIFRFNCNAGWIVSCEADWITISSREGERNGIITLTCDENTELTSRSSILSVNSDGEVIEVSLSQPGALPYLDIVEPEFTVSSEEEVLNIRIESNVEYTISIPVGTDWMTTELSGNPGIMKFNIMPNRTISARDVFIYTTQNNGTLKDSVKIIQPFSKESRACDSLALVAIYNSTNGATWARPWERTQPITSWDGVVTSDINNQVRVTELRLWENNITGTLPSQYLDYLSELTMFHLADNNIGGSIPEVTGGMINVELIALQGNLFEGNVPGSIGLLTKLQDFYISGNKLSGQIPLSILNHPRWSSWNTAGFCDQRVGFGFSNCQSSLTIEQIEREALLALYSSTNGATWLMPWDISQPVTSWNGVVTAIIDGQTRVIELRLWDNNLTGVLPFELSVLSELTMIHVGGNQITGGIPFQYENLTKLTMLALQNNQLTGSVPKELANITGLENFWINNNRLSGVIPVEILNHPRWSAWSSAGFCDQQPGYGFSNCQ
jgi:hypothetical protein